MRISRFFTGRSETASMALSKQFPKSVQISIEDTDPPSVHPCACGCCLHRLPVSLPCLCLLRFGSTNNYHRSGRKSTDFSEDRNIFHAVPRALEISILCLLRRSFYTISDIEIQFLRKLRTVKTVLFLAAKKACKHARRSFHNADPAACRLPVNHSFEPLPTEVCAIPGPFRLWPAFQSR